jgi:short-subunit dehydrogenase
MRGGADGTRPHRILVTGASRGIGRAVALHLAAQGHQVIGTSRDPTRIPEVERIPGVRYVALDLTDQASVEGILAVVGDVDVVVNNAGASQTGAIEEASMPRVRRLFELNLFGQLRLIQGVLPGMRRNRRGLIINVASFAGVSPVPFSAVYAASKAALIAVSRGLRHEVAPWGIRVVVVAPFDIATGIPQERYGEEDSPYRSFARQARAARDRRMREAPGPRIVAKRILRIISSDHPRPFVPVGRAACLMALLVKHLPETLVDRVLARQFVGR